MDGIKLKGVRIKMTICAQCEQRPRYRGKSYCRECFAAGQQLADYWRKPLKGPYVREAKAVCGKGHPKVPRQDCKECERLRTLKKRQKRLDNLVRWNVRMARVTCAQVGCHASNVQSPAKEYRCVQHAV